MTEQEFLSFKWSNPDLSNLKDFKICDECGSITAYVTVAKTYGSEGTA